MRDFMRSSDDLQDRAAKILVKKMQGSLTVANGIPEASIGRMNGGACPLHGSTAGTARCFSVNTHAHTFHCFKCNRSGNALDLWTYATRLSIYDAAIDLCQRLNSSCQISDAGSPKMVI